MLWIPVRAGNDLMGAIRLFLAYSVLLDHECLPAMRRGLSCDHSWALNVTGAQAVIFFYIISGFLMSYVLSSKYPATKTGTYQFYKARFLRIYPLWWAVMAVCVIIDAGLWPTNVFQVVGSGLLVGTDWMAFVRAQGLTNASLFAPDASIGWTLGAELTFYLLAPYVLRSGRLALAAFVGSATVRLGVLLFVSRDVLSYYEAWSYFFLPSTFMFFMLGHLARRTSYFGTAGPWPSFALLIVAGWLTSRKGWPPVDDWFAANDYLAAFIFAAALPGLFEATKNNRLSNWLGDLTYPLYLTHFIVLSVFLSDWPLIGSFGHAVVHFAQTAPSPYVGSAVFFGVIVLICLAAAGAVHFLVENPLRFLCSRIIEDMEELRTMKQLRTLARIRLKPTIETPLFDRKPDLAE
jgi:peptidoglycan/LPS O-acetylase OafA/YrhL